MLDWANLVAERNAWIQHNFPTPKCGRDPAESVIGCIEEVGELAHAHLKQAQSIRGTDEQHSENARDAIGDLTVYLFGVMQAWDTLPEPLSAPGMFVPDANVCIIVLGAAVGELAKAHALGVHSQGTIDNIVYYSALYAELRGWEYEEIVQGTWDAVKERDWIAYPDTGRPGGVDTGLTPEEKAARSDGDPGNAVTPPLAADAS